MANYHVELPSRLTLNQQSKAIEGEEALAARFVGLRIWVNAKNVLTNLAEFEELDSEPDSPLGKPKLTKTLPDGVTPDWAGGMIVQGAAVSQVFLIREAAD
jgi:hypothetical protein